MFYEITGLSCNPYEANFSTIIEMTFEEKFACKNCQCNAALLRDNGRNLPVLKNTVMSFVYYLANSGSIIQIAKKYASVLGGWLHNLDYGEYCCC